MARDRLNEELLRLRAEQNWTAVFVTHSVAEAVFLSTRIVVLAPSPGRIAQQIAVDLPFPDHSFDAVVSINTIHNLPRAECITALREIERVTKGSRAYVQVDSYFTEDEKSLFKEWVLTAYTHDYPDGWRKIFAEAGYQGDYYWTLV